MFRLKLIEIAPDGERKKYGLPNGTLERALSTLEASTLSLMAYEERKGNTVDLVACEEGTCNCRYTLAISTPSGKTYTRELYLQ